MRARAGRAGRGEVLGPQRHHRRRVAFSESRRAGRGTRIGVHVRGGQGPGLVANSVLQERNALLGRLLDGRGRCCGRVAHAGGGARHHRSRCRSASRAPRRPGRCSVRVSVHAWRWRRATRRASRGRRRAAAGSRRRRSTRQFAPSTATVDAVRSWASAGGLSVDSVSANRTLVRRERLRGGGREGVRHDAADVQGAGRQHVLRAVRGGEAAGGVWRGSTTAVLGPVEPRPRRLLAQQASSVNFPASYGPQDIAVALRRVRAPTGSGQQVSVIAEGDLDAAARRISATFEDTSSGCRT